MWKNSLVKVTLILCLVIVQLILHIQMKIYSSLNAFYLAFIGSWD